MIKINKFNKFTFIFSMIFLLSLFYVNATLVDSEDFESYTPNVTIDNMINDSGGKWNCSTFYPDCVDGIDGDSDGDSAYVQVQQEDSNFLRIQSVDGDSADYSYVYMMWDSIDTTINSYNNFTISYDVKLFNYGCGSGLSNTLLDTSNFRMPIEPARFLDSDLNKYISPLMMGYQNNISSDVNTIIGSVYDTTSNDRLPFNSTLSIEDGEWHSITNYYIFNATSHLINVQQYNDGILANQQIGNKDYGVGWHTVGFLHSLSFTSGMCWDIGIDNIKIYEDELAPPQTLPSEEGEIFNCSLTQCSTWSKPFYLYEEFNGSINDCEWATTENVCFNFELERNLSESYYSINKYCDLLTESDSRYATISFDLKPVSINTNGFVSISVYDESQRFIQFFLSDDMKFYNNDGGASELVYSNVINNTYKTVEFHIDFTNNDFDLWYDGNKVNESLGLSNNFLDIENIQTVSITSNDVEYSIDEFEVYTSDQNNEILPTDTEIIQPISTEKSMCGLFYKTDVECSLDSDCVTDDCKPNGKCNHFDMTYCDENGYTRGNKCFVSAVTYCTLDSTQEIILDNFLLFLVFIIIIIFIVYLIFMLKS